MLRWLGLSRDDGANKLPRDSLAVQHLVSGKPVFQAHSGVPYSADSLAYEPVQRLLAVATNDGRVKIVGRDGVERTMYSTASAVNSSVAPAATRQLLFLINRGGIVRLCKDGLLELFSVEPSSSVDDPSQPLARLTVPDDQVCCVCQLQQEPYLLLGCTSGAVRVAALVNASGDVVAGTRPARGLTLLPYTITPRRLDAAGSVCLLAVQSSAPYQHLLSLHQESGVAVWDLRAQALVTRVHAGSSGSSSQIVAAEWLQGSGRGDFATGHVNGDINIWSIGETSSGSSWQATAQVAASMQQMLQPQLLTQLRVTPSAGSSAYGQPQQQRRSASPLRGKPVQQQQQRQQPVQRCRPVASLQQVSMGRAEGLLVFGGGDEMQPDGLVLLPLPEPKLALGIDDPTTCEEQQQSAAASALKLPWLGFILGNAVVPSQGSLAGKDDPSAVLVLMEGGEVAVHDLSNFAAAAAAAAATAAAAAAAAAAATTPARSGSQSSGAGSPTRRQLQQQGLSPRLSAGSDPSPFRVLQGGGGSGSSADPTVPAPPQRLFTQKLQGQPLVTAARLRIIPIDRVPLQGLQGACMSSLHEWASRNAASSAAKGVDAASRWVVAGGKPAPPPTSSSGSGGYATVYCTGHSDGGVRLWAMHGEAPQLLGLAPSSAAAKALQGQRVSPVSTLEFAWEQGLLVSGHEGGEVRVYQFSETAKRMDCVIFESVGSRSNNESLTVEEPSGFQLRLLTRLHSSDIVSSAYLPQFKMVAVSDRSGSVSLIDLSKPAVPWFQAPWSNQPVASLALGNVPLPHTSERHPALQAALEDQAAAGQRAAVATGAPVRAVVAVAADSQVAVLDAATGFFLSRTGVLVPKHMCPALHAELLDASGAPTWMCRDVQALIDACSKPQHKQQPQQQSSSSSTHQAEQSGSSGSAHEGSPAGGFARAPLRQAAAAAGAAGAAGDEYDEGSDASSSAEGELDEELGVDELLEKAAAEVDARGRKKSSHKSKRHSSGSSNRASSSSRSAEPGGGSHHRSKSPIQRILHLPGKSQQRASSSSGSTTATRVSAASSSAPIVLSEPLAAYVLTATRDYLRLYPISRAITGDRTAAKRVELHGRLQFASSFAANGAPALVCLIELEHEVHMQVYTLPNLELVRDMPLSALLGWRWRWDNRHTMPSRVSSPCHSNGATSSIAAHRQPAPMQKAVSEPIDPTAAAAAAAATAAAVAASGSRLASVCAATRHGHLALLGPGSELVRLGLAVGAAGAPVPAAAVYDCDLATAASAAGSAMDRQQMQAWQSSSRTAAGGSGDAASAAERAAREEDEALAAAAAAVGGGGLKGFIGNIGGGLTRGLSTAFDATQKGLQKVVQAPFKPSQQQLQEYPYPAVGVLFGAPAAAAASPEYAPTGRRQAAARPASTRPAAAAAGTDQTSQGPSSSSSSSRVLRASTASFKNVSFAEDSSSSQAAAAAAPPVRGLYRQTSKDEDSLLEAQQAQRKHRAPLRRSVSSTQLGVEPKPDGVFERPSSLLSDQQAPSSSLAVESQQSLSPRSPLGSQKSGGSFRQQSGLPLGFGSLFGAGGSGSAGNSSGSLPTVSPRAAAAAGVDFGAAPGSPGVSPRAAGAPATLEEVAARLGLFGSGGGSSSIHRFGGGPGPGDRRQSTMRNFAGQASRLMAIPSTEVLPLEASSMASGLPRQVTGQQHSLAPHNSLAPAGSAAPNRQKSGIGGTIWQQQSGGAGAFSTGPAGAANRVRTADEIRQAYGRPSLKANETRAIMDETRAALAARGERLSQLQEQTADLAESAAGFAELAKQLADKEKGKGKWFG